VLLTTQYLDEADNLAGHIVIVDHGKAIAAGTPAELKRLLGRSVIEVVVREREDLPRVAGTLARLGAEPHVHHATRRVSVAVTSGEADLMSGLLALQEAGISVDEIALRHPSLDEVFLALTGQPLEHEEEETMVEEKAEVPL